VRQLGRRAYRQVGASLIGGLVLAGSAFVAVSLSAAPASAATTLGGGAEAQGGRYFGTAVSASRLSNTALTNVAGTQFDMMTPENDMKWDTVQPAQTTFNFGPGDQIVNFARSHNQRLRGHNLVWHSQLPGWVSSLPTNQVQAAMENHITMEVNHWRGLYAWDVVNEPFNEAGSLRSDPFLTAMGSGYIADALRTARAADPNAKLYLNDFNIEANNTAKSNAMFTLAQSLLNSGAPLNGIGFEAHFIQGQVPSSLQANMQRFANLGLDVAITELDVRMPTASPNLQGQANDFLSVVNACLAVSRCVGITQWNVGDADSWVPGVFSGQGLATMFDNNYQPKPAFTTVLNRLNQGVTTPPPTSGTTTTPPPTTPRSTPPPTTPPPTTGPPGACTATYTTVNSWPQGFQGGITVNAGSSAINGWTLTWTLSSGQTITQLWNGALTVSGTNVTVRNLSYNGSIPAGGNTTLGFVASGAPSSPTVRCTSP